METTSQVQETTTAPEVNATPTIEVHVQRACDIATNKTAPDQTEAPRRIIGAKKDLNCKGMGTEIYRMVYRGGDWRYVSDDRLPSGNFRASDRRAQVDGDVYTGEIIAQHDRGGPIDVAYLCVGPNVKTIQLDAPVKQRDGNLRFTLPDGSKVVLPNPRKK